MDVIKCNIFIGYYRIKAKAAPAYRSKEGYKNHAIH